MATAEGSNAVGIPVHPVADPPCEKKSAKSFPEALRLGTWIRIGARRGASGGRPYNPSAMA